MKAFMIAALVFTLIFGCGKKKEEPNKVDFDQMNVDESTNYMFIFRDLIQDEKLKSKKYKKEKF